MHKCPVNISISNLSSEFRLIIESINQSINWNIYNRGTVRTLGLWTLDQYYGSQFPSHQIRDKGYGYGYGYDYDYDDYDGSGYSHS